MRWSAHKVRERGERPQAEIEVRVQCRPQCVTLRGERERETSDRADEEDELTGHNVSHDQGGMLISCHVFDPNCTLSNLDLPNCVCFLVCLFNFIDRRRSGLVVPPASAVMSMSVPPHHSHQLRVGRGRGCVPDVTHTAIERSSL